MAPVGFIPMGPSMNVPIENRPAGPYCDSSVWVRMPAFLRKADAMLVLSRKAGEDILIGKDVRVRVIAAQGGQVRLGILAPREVEVLRAELASRAKPGRSVLQGAGAER